MDPTRFDWLVRELAAGASRRTALLAGVTTLAATALTGLGAMTPPGAEAKKKRHKKKKKKQTCDSGEVTCPVGSVLPCCPLGATCCPAGLSQGCCQGSSFNPHPVCCPVPDGGTICCHTNCCTSGAQCTGGQTCQSGCCL